MKPEYRTAVFLMIVVMFTAPFIPPVTGDGMPIYSYVRDDEEARTLYSSTFESRQLANVELLNDTHQRIDLFLSIFSLEPYSNLSVLVPFRERPVEVNMEKGTDSEFLKVHEYEDIIEEANKQDLGRTSKRFAKRTGNVLKDIGTSATTTPLGLMSVHVARSYTIVDSDYKGYETMSDESDGEDATNREVEEVSHYEFDGASISIYSVSANATLEDFISVVDLGTLPTVTREVVEEYKEQYVAVIETEPSPPIPEYDFRWMNEAIPYTMEGLKEQFQKEERISYREAQAMVIEKCRDGLNEIWINRQDLRRTMGINITDDFELIGWGSIYEFLEDEWVWEYGHRETPFDLLSKMESLVFSVYGFTDFEGHTLSVTTELNEGNLYFPLGTSKGWDNPISETIIIMRTEKDGSLDINIDPMYSAFMDDGHYYIVEYFDANPSEDIVASMKDASFGEKLSSSTSKFIHYNTVWAPFFIAFLGEILLWFFLLWIFRSTSEKNKEMKVATGKNLMIGSLNVLLSAPITYIIFVRDPLSGRIGIEDRDERRIYNFSFISYIALNIVLLVWGMM